MKFTGIYIDEDGIWRDDSERQYTGRDSGLGIDYSAANLPTEGQHTAATARVVSPVL